MSHADEPIRWFHSAGALARDGWESVVDDSLPGWEHTGLHVARLDPSAPLTLPGAAVERLVVPLAGWVEATVVDPGGEQTVHALAGRHSVFDGPSDVLYVTSGSVLELRGSGRVAVASSPTAEQFPTRLVTSAETPVELRGAGTSSRQVHNFGTPDALDAARFIVCEVITPAGNWSSYPPHKHDEHVDGHESRLEEIYYFEATPTRGAAASIDADAAFGLFSTSSSPAGEIAIDAQVRTGDIALVPFGYHGPAVAAPGYDLYYLNVMAGPDPERAWRITDDPRHTWVRGEWDGQSIDARLPYTTEGTHR
ncbi:5-deoxyglucuronate isomerase [Labedella gwakjiensis]|uniref:5-deoxyglucuronate isomerase n=1 Tax=Labedella gwakjiensis TaxID=390269 RepID=A0A2P8GRE2_9MICO|nr:5-deoxy-glucuronate isomerase [Labedella gwakjiensis]PSL36549.1 5-deoxyglucuronate isomerase [Labedella gwakjiensis]